MAPTSPGRTSNPATALSVGAAGEAAAPGAVAPGTDAGTDAAVSGVAGAAVGAPRRPRAVRRPGRLRLGRAP
ncbi:hypothetical protein I7412_33675, partial [Frankia sp. CN6]|nr:hypothetical protein [Frankia nepalensis]